MEALNALSAQSNEDVWSEGYWVLASVLEPIVPHVCWEISSELFGLNNLVSQEIIQEVFKVDTINIGVSVNGKKRSEIEIGIDDAKDQIVAAAKRSVAKWIEDKEIIKEIVVPNRLVNIVIKG